MSTGITPKKRRELFEAAMAGDISTSDLPTPVTRDEKYMYEAATSGGGGGGNISSANVTAMTGYSKAAEAADISTSDTLNAAMGKLEKGVDDNKTNISSVQGELTYSPLCNFKQGGLHWETGSVSPTTRAIYTTDFVDEAIIKISCSSDFKINIFAYNKITGEYVGHLVTDGTFKKTNVYLFVTEFTFNWNLGYKYRICFYNADNTTDILPTAGVNLNCVTNKLNYFQQYLPINQPIKRAKNPNFTGTPVTIFANDDSAAIAGVDDGLLNTVSVVKINDSMYYMYYEGFGADGTADYSNINLCFAYSTDGATFIKGFPQGIEPPISGTNLLLPKGSTHGHCVVRLSESEFRMVTIDASGANRIAKIWKSSDGINWTVIRQITDGYNDSMVSCVLRGNLLKIFLRTRNSYGRAIGVITTDIDGNRTTASWDSVLSLNDSAAQLYQASASILDDKCELLIPTVYNPNTSVQYVMGVIVDDDVCQPVYMNNNTVMDNNVKSIYFASGIVDINRKTYAYYVTRDSDHEHFVMGTTKSAIKRIEIVDGTYTNVVAP